MLTVACLQPFITEVQRKNMRLKQLRFGPDSSRSMREEHDQLFAELQAVAPEYRTKAKQFNDCVKA
jgi:hypothetical protein